MSRPRRAKGMPQVAIAGTIVHFPRDSSTQRCAQAFRLCFYAEIGECFSGFRLPRLGGAYSSSLPAYCGGALHAIAMLAYMIYKLGRISTVEHHETHSFLHHQRITPIDQCIFSTACDLANSKNVALNKNQKPVNCLEFTART